MVGGITLVGTCRRDGKTGSQRDLGPGLLFFKQLPQKLTGGPLRTTVIPSVGNTPSDQTTFYWAPPHNSKEQVSST